MNTVPPNFPSYSSYNVKTLLQHVDTLKLCVKELQTEVSALKAAQTAQVAEKAKKEPKNA